MCRAGGEQQPRSANFVTKFHVSCGPEWSRNEEQCNCNPGVLRERFPGVLREIVGAAGSRVDAALVSALRDKNTPVVSGWSSGQSVCSCTPP